MVFSGLRFLWICAGYFLRTFAYGGLDAGLGCGWFDCGGFDCGGYRLANGA